MDFLVIFWLYGFLENVFLNKFFSFMDFSLIWTILAGTNVVHISGVVDRLQYASTVMFPKKY